MSDQQSCDPWLDAHPPRLSVRRFDGAIFSLLWKDVLCAGLAPQARQRNSVKASQGLTFHKLSYATVFEARQVIEVNDLLAAIADSEAQTMRVARTWLDVERGTVADMTSPKRVMGDLLGDAVRFGEAGRILACSERVEAILSIGTALPGLPVGVIVTPAPASPRTSPTRPRCSASR